MGCKTNFFGNEELSKHCLTLKTTYDAITIRNRILQVFEDIISSNDIEKEALQNIVIVGAGPTGVELAGAFAEIKKNILPKDYPGIDFSKLKIILIEGSGNTLNNMSQLAKSASKKYLLKMNIDVICNTFVTNYDGNILQLNSGDEIYTKTVIWTAGVTANKISGIPDNWIATGNRIEVDRTNKVIEKSNIFVVGDMAMMKTPKYPYGHPQIANVAINQAKNLAINLKRIIQNRTLKEYEYADLGNMATVGTNKAIVDLPFGSFKGFFAWMTWMFLHLMLILSVKNKLIIFINWAWAYITKNTALRLILKENKG